MLLHEGQHEQQSAQAIEIERQFVIDDTLSLTLQHDGTIWAWGKNQSGQLGDGTVRQRTTPVQVSGLTGVTAIGAGINHSLALLSDGTVRAWGPTATGSWATAPPPSAPRR